MSVRTQESYRMPQPEKWLSEHEPWATLAIVLAVVLFAILVLR